MGNLLIAEPTLSDAASVTATNASGTAPAFNLQTMQPKEILEITNVSGTKTITWDLGAGASYDFFALLFTNLTASATWTIQTDDNSGFLSPTTVLASTTFRAPGQNVFGITRAHGFYKHASTLTEQYARMQLVDGSNPDGVMRIGRGYVVPAWRVDGDYGLIAGFVDEAPFEETPHGERIHLQREPIPKIQIPLSLDGASAWNTLQANLHLLFLRRGASRDVIVITDPEDTGHSGRLVHYGTLQQQLAYSYDAFQVYRSTLEVRGLI